MTDDSDTLHLPRPLAVQLMHAAQCEPEREVCGLIAGRDGRPVRYLPVRNVAEHPESAFEMEPAGQVRALAAIREAGESLWAVFHSHPGTPAEPSTRDLDRLGYPEAYPVIASLNIKGVLELRCWELREGQPRERIMRVHETEPTSGAAT